MVDIWGQFTHTIVVIPIYCISWLCVGDTTDQWWQVELLLLINLPTVQDASLSKYLAYWADYYLHWLYKLTLCFLTFCSTLHCLQFSKPASSSMNRIEKLPTWKDEKKCLFFFVVFFFGKAVSRQGKSCINCDSEHTHTAHLKSILHTEAAASSQL